MLLQRRALDVRGVDERLAALRNPHHHHIPELVRVAVGDCGAEDDLRAPDVERVPIRDLDLLRVVLQGLHERARPLPLAPVDVELAVLQERPLPLVDRGRAGFVVIEVVVAHGEDVRRLRGIADSPPEVAPSVFLDLVGREIVAIWAQSHPRVDENFNVRRFYEGRHRASAKGVRGEGRDLHRFSRGTNSSFSRIRFQRVSRFRIEARSISSRIR